MMPNTRNILRAVSLVAALAAGSCASPTDPGNLFDDPMVNHPIQVQPNYHSLKLAFSAPDAGLMPDDAQKFDAFVGDFMQHGNGAISISVAPGGDSNAAIAYFGERLAAAGVPRDRILVGTRETGGDGRVELGYIGYQASTPPCGDWSADLSFTADNQVSPNFGCSVQHNVAAQVADPRDLVAPRQMGSGDAARRATVYNNYKEGKPTGATQTADQSGAVSDVAK